jgi:cupin 2 domain-containing protein
MNNLFSNIPGDLPDELLETVLDAGSVRIARIVSRGQASPEGFWYDQEQHEWVLVLRGSARLRFENPDKFWDLEPGDFVNIPAHQRHRVDWTSSEEPTVWLTVHYGDE